MLILKIKYPSPKHTGKPWKANAIKTINSILTCRTIITRLGQTFVKIYITIITGKPWPTETLIAS